MKSDYSRITFDERKHFSSVRMQQGRVQIDADSNEQIDIVNHRFKTETGDVVGLCGAPLHFPAFHIVSALDQLSAEEQSLPENKTLPEGFASPDFLISAGRYYVDGLLCENEKLTSYLGQPDLPDAPAIAEAGFYLVYLDVWQRLVTALDDPSIREIALGGPDTATRAKTVWQVKHWFAGDKAANCLTNFKDFEKLIAQSDGKLNVRNKPGQTSTDPCIVPPGAGYTGLENQLYRIEIHDGGEGLDAAEDGELATRVSNSNDQLEVSGKWEEGDAIEIFSPGSGSDSKSATVAHILKVVPVRPKAQAAKPTKSDKTERPKVEAKRILTLDIDVTGIPLDRLFVRRASATYKWSRDNGTVVTTIKSVDGQEITVHSLGPDSVLGFQKGHWVEISDNGLELNGKPGQLAKIVDIDRATNLITLNVAVSLPKGLIPERHPKLRRWDGIGAVKSSTDNDLFVDLENGVQVSFFKGTFKTGDYWTAAARTATADSQLGTIEWPSDADGAPLAQLPFGIEHHYCRVAMLHWDGRAFDKVEDCRNLFPPITELTSLFYVSGDGQEVKPDLTQPAAFLPLPQTLIVGVANGEIPVPNAEVRFKVDTTKGNGKVLPVGAPGTFHQVDATTLGVLTDKDGLARCIWQLDSTTDSQQIKASLQAVSDLTDAADHPVHLPVIFTANLSVARQVAYDPGDCEPFRGDKNVQDALNRVSHLISLYEVSGNNQEFVPGESLRPLIVLAANRCGPVTDGKLTVHFKVVSGAGKVDGRDEIDVLTDGNGLASCVWTPGSTEPNQEVEASLVPDLAHSVTEPTRQLFTGTASLAKHVFYDPRKCPGLQQDKVANVQDAIDHLCEVQRGANCDVTVGKGGQFERLDQALTQLIAQDQTDICICLMPGDHSLETLVIEGEGNRWHLKITGCGRGSRLIVKESGSFKAARLASLTMRDVEVFGENLVIEIDQCRDVTFEGCHLTQENQGAPFIKIARARRIRFENNVVAATLPIKTPRPASFFARTIPSFSSLFLISNRLNFERESIQAVSPLARESAANRKSMATALTQQLAQAGRQVTPKEARSFNNFIETLADPAADARALQAALADIRLVSLAIDPGVAILLMDAEAETRIEDNQITGIVSLYGLPGSTRLSDDEVRALIDSQSKKIEFSGSLATLHMRNNLVSRMDVSEKTLALVKSPGSDGSISLKQLYRRCFITDNEFSSGDNTLITEQLALTSNSFDGLTRVGVAIANAATYVGNYAGSPKRILFSAVQLSEKAANLAIDIVD